jgi:hypothetical protein
MTEEAFITVNELGDGFANVISSPSSRIEGLLTRYGPGENST